MAGRKNKGSASKPANFKASGAALEPAASLPAQAIPFAAEPEPAPAFEAPAAVTALAQIESAQAVTDFTVEAVASAETVTETATETVIEGIETMNTETIDRIQETQQAAADRFQETQQAAAGRFQATFGDVNERSRDAMQKSARLVEEFTDLTRGNVEAFVASSKVAARGVEQLSQEAAEFSRRSFEQASATLKSFTEVRSPTDLFKLQSDYARSAFDNMVSESSKMSEAVIKLAGEVAEPITSRYAVAAERVKNVTL